MTQGDRPDSLVTFGLRTKIFIEECRSHGETLTALARQAHLTPNTLREIVKGNRPLPNTSTLMAIDDLGGGHLLTREERAWAEQTRKRYLARWKSHR